MFIALHQSVKGVLVYEQGLWPGPRGSVGFGPPGLAMGGRHLSALEAIHNIMLH